jgi:DNA-binding CsgD family transcriptional regulator
MASMAASPADPWDELVPELIMACGSSGFPFALDKALQRVAPFDLTITIRYSGAALRPSLLHDGLGQRSAKAIRTYLEGAYLLDAAYTACTHGAEPGLYRLHDLAPDGFFEGEYFNSPEVHPCISMERGSLAEEIVFIARGGNGAYTAYSLMRSHGWPRFSNEEMTRLRGCAPVVLGLIGRQWPDEGPQTPPRLNRDEDEGTVVEEAFRSFGEGMLTRREQTVVSLVLRGHSTLSIAKVLGIGEGTVKSHRKAIHAKLGIASQVQLFSLFVTHVLARDQEKRAPALRALLRSS